MFQYMTGKRPVQVARPGYVHCGQFGYAPPQNALQHHAACGAHMEAVLSIGNPPAAGELL